MAAATSSPSTFYPTIPLTTTFVPPYTCLSTIVDGPFGGLTLGAGIQCIPSGANIWTRAYAFSPALNCPHDYTTVAESVSESGSALVTKAICCPEINFGALSGIPFHYNPDTSAYQWDTTLGCTLTNFNTVEFLVLSNGAYTLTPGAGLNAYSVQIAWQVSDLSAASTGTTNIPSTTISSTITPSTTIPSMTITSVATLSAASTPSSMVTTQKPAVPTTTIIHPTSTTFASASAASTPGLSSTSTDTSLSTGTKIAIGVTVPVGVLAIFLITILGHRRWLSRRALRHGAYGGVGSQGEWVDKS